MEEWCPGAQFHLSDSHHLGNRLRGCEGPEAKGLVCLSCWSPPCHAEVHGLGRGFVLQTVPASCTNEVELTFVTAEKAESTIS